MVLTTINFFWKTVQPLFGNKIKNKSQIAFVEGKNLVTDHKARARAFNNFLSMLLPPMESSMRS